MKSQTTIVLEKVLESLPPACREQCLELAEHFRRQVAAAGEIVGPLAFALVGEELSTAADETP